MRTVLSEICVSITDCEHKTAPKDPLGEYYAVGTPAMAGHAINLNLARRISFETFDLWTRRLRPRAGDLLLAREAPVGHVVLIPTEANVAPGQRTVLLRPNQELVSSKFLYYYLTAPQSQSALQVKASGSTVAHLNVSDLREFLVELPPLAHQNAIAEVLGVLDDKIAANAALAQTLMSLADSYYELAAHSAEESVSLSELVDTQYGLTISPTETGEARLIRVTDINKRPWIEVSGSPMCTPSEQELIKYTVYSGDILVARMADPGKVGIVDEEMPESVFASYLVRLKPRRSDLALFLFHFLRSNSYRDYSLGAMSGSVQKNMNARVIVGTDVSLPTDSALATFNATTASLRRLMQASLGESSLLSNLRDTLLPELMSGRLRVKDAERQVEEVV